MPIRPRRPRNHIEPLSRYALVELLSGHAGPDGSTFDDYEARLVAFDRLPEVLDGMNRLHRMQLDNAVEHAKRGHWPPALRKDR